jgi:hypothetical protein
MRFAEPRPCWWSALSPSAERDSRLPGQVHSQPHVPRPQVQPEASTRSHPVTARQTRTATCRVTTGVICTAGLNSTTATIDPTSVLGVSREAPAAILAQVIVCATALAPVTSRGQHSERDPTRRRLVSDVGGWIEADQGRPQVIVPTRCTRRCTRSSSKGKIQPVSPRQATGSGPDETG